jgi:signal transduction histidine kinase
MTRRLVASYLGLTAVVILALGVPLAIAYQHDVQHDRTLQIQAGVGALATLVDDSREGSISLTAPVLADHYGVQLRARMIVLDARGRILADSGVGGSRLQFMPPVRRAAAGQITSGGLGGRLYTIASTVGGGHVLAIYAPVGVNGTVRHYWLLIGLFAVGALVVATLIGLVLARSLSRPLRRLQRAVVGTGENRRQTVPVAGPSEVRTLAEGFNAANTELNRLLDAQAAWVSDASHELRTPLAALRLRLENAQAAPTRDDDIAAALIDVDRLTHLTDELLALSRVDAAAGTPSPIDVEAVINDRLALWAPLAAEQQVQLVAHVERHPIAASSSGALEQELDNLLANAFDAAPAHSSITVSATASGDVIELHVTDEGAGLTPEERVRAFDRFWRGGAARPGEGSGLGLAIVRRLVERDRGTVELQPAASGGVDAVIRLPTTTDQTSDY